MSTWQDEQGRMEAEREGEKIIREFYRRVGIDPSELPDPLPYEELRELAFLESMRSEDFDLMCEEDAKAHLCCVLADADRAYGQGEHVDGASFTAGVRERYGL